MTNESNYRQTPCLVSYGDQRLVGEGALANIKKNLKNSIYYPTRFLGKINQQQFQHEKKFNFSKAFLENEKAYFEVQN